jgi:hypothetical protein
LEQAAQVQQTELYLSFPLKVFRQSEEALVGPFRNHKVRMEILAALVVEVVTDRLAATLDKVAQELLVKVILVVGQTVMAAATGLVAVAEVQVQLEPTPLQ